MGEPTKTQRWFGVAIAVAPEATEAIEYAFNSLDSLGTEINHLGKANSEAVTVVGYFNELPNDDLLRDEFHYALRIYGLNEEAISSVEQHEIEDADWLHEWKKHWKPTTIGRFVITPPWESIDETEKIIIRIEPNMAFGTGTHETTQLCLKSITDNYDPGDSFLDVGTGTGILAIAAAKMNRQSAASSESETKVPNILACDTDRDSIKIARENAEMNNVGEEIEFIDGPVPADTPMFDFVCANLTIDVILPLLPLLLEKSRKTLILSGILVEQQAMIRRALRDAGIKDHRIEYAGEWIAVTVAKVGEKLIAVS